MLPQRPVSTPAIIPIAGYSQRHSARLMLESRQHDQLCFGCIQWQHGFKRSNIYIDCLGQMLPLAVQQCCWSCRSARYAHASPARISVAPEAQHRQLCCLRRLRLWHQPGLALDCFASGACGVLRQRRLQQFAQVDCYKLLQYVAIAVSAGEDQHC